MRVAITIIGITLFGSISATSIAGTPTLPNIPKLMLVNKPSFSPLSDPAPSMFLVP